eukprot:gene5624-6198_t
MMDGRGRVHRVWGGISRKAYDGDFLKLYKEELNRGFNVGSVMVDKHFPWRREGLQNLKFYVYCVVLPNRKRKRIPNEPEENEVAKLSKEQAAFNAQHQGARAMVERPFRPMRTLFQSLASPWAKSWLQQD